MNNNGSKKKAPKNGQLEEFSEQTAKDKLQKVLEIIERNTEEKRKLKEYAKRLTSGIKML